jgi:hypothetical protein
MAIETTSKRIASSPSVALSGSNRGTRPRSAPVTATATAPPITLFVGSPAPPTRLRTAPCDLCDINHRGFNQSLEMAHPAGARRPASSSEVTLPARA